MTEVSAKVWLQLEEQLNNKLWRIENKFWELNVPDIEELARLRILEGVTYVAQKEGTSTGPFLGTRGSNSDLCLFRPDSDPRW